MNLLKNFIREQEGQDGVEYALLIGFVSAAIVLTATNFTSKFDGFWTSSGNAVKAGGTKLDTVAAQ